MKSRSHDGLAAEGLLLTIFSSFIGEEFLSQVTPCVPHFIQFLGHAAD